jgi:hypothetical protein
MGCPARPVESKVDCTAARARRMEKLYEHIDDIEIAMMTTWRPTDTAP